MFSVVPLTLLLAVCLPADTQVTTVTTTTTLRRDADPLVDTTANGRGRVNYNAGVVRATGSGAPPAEGVASNPAQARLMALGAAKADALRNLAMAVSAVQVTSETRVKNFQTESDTIETRLDALLHNPKVIQEDFDRDGTARVTVELPLYGPDSVAAAVLPEVLKDDATEAPSSDWKGPDEPAVPLPPARTVKPLPPLRHEPGLTPASDDGPFTSIIIDCRGLGIEGAMAPKLLDDSGREVYGTVRVDPDFAIAVGIVGYPRSMSEAIRSQRAGAHPLIVRAERAGDAHRFNPVIAAEDADRILLANRRDHFLEKTAVIFLVDPIK